MTVIGIDLGTTNCCVAAFRFGKVQIFANDMGHRLTPSYVAFTDKERLFGTPAKHQMTLNPENTIYAIKRIIGRDCNDPKVTKDVNSWPFNVINENGKPKVNVTFKGEELILAPEQVSAMLLEKMKQTAEAYIGQVVQAVITVPAYFNDAQRQATKDAGAIAGLSVLQIINEPTAAVLAYGMESQINGNGHVMVFDLGGGTCDISILKISKGSQFETLVIGGDTHLGGLDFDNELVIHCVKEFRKKYNKDLSSNSRAMNRLRIAAEHAKHMLSCSTETTIVVEESSEEFHIRISRARFEALCSDLFKRALDIVQCVFNDSGLSKHDIEDIVLVGGSTRIPKLRNMLKSFFGPKTRLKHSINPDEAVGYGAAIHAARLCGDTSVEIEDYMVTDVVPISLGIEIKSTEMAVVIRRNTAVPCERTRDFSTTFDNQTKLDINVFEGENSQTHNNHHLGTFTLEGITQAKKQTPLVKVTFKLDVNGILTVTAAEKSAGKEVITVNYDKGRLSKSEIDRMINEAKQYALVDKMYNQKKKARNDLTEYVYQIIENLESAGDTVGQKELLDALSHCKKTLEWIADTFDCALLEQYGEKKNSLKMICDPLLEMARNPLQDCVDIVNVD